jgi:hypothetical protein
VSILGPKIPDLTTWEDFGENALVMLRAVSQVAASFTRRITQRKENSDEREKARKAKRLTVIRP